MYPVTITVHNDDQLKAVHAALSGNAQPESAAPAKAKAVKEKAAPAAATTPAATATPAATPAATGLTDAGKEFLQSKLAAPVMELSMKNEPAMKAIVAEYGVERVSLIPEKFFPEVLQKVNDALDPGAAERKRLEGLDKARSLI